MAQILSLDSVMDDLLPVGNRLMDEWIDVNADDPDFQWPNQVFKIEKARGWKEEFRSSKGIEKWPEWEENEPTPILEFGKIEKAQVKPTQFKAGFIITETMLEWGLERALDPGSPLINDMETFVEQFMLSGWARYPEMAAGVFLNAFSAAAQPMRDGSALIDTVHVDIPGSNKITTKLSLQALEELDNLRLRVDVRGMPRMARWDTIIVGPDNETKLDTILQSTNNPEAGPDGVNAVNTRKGRYKKVVLPWLDNAIQSGASDYFFVLDSRIHNLKGRILRLPSFQRAFQVDEETFRMPAKAIFYLFALNNAGIAGSTGTVAPS